MNLTLSAFNFNNDYTFHVIETNKETVEDYSNMYSRVSYSMPKASYNSEKVLVHRIRVLCRN